MGVIVLLWVYRGVYDKFLLYWNGMGLRDFIIKDMGAGVYMGGRKGAGFEGLKWNGWHAGLLISACCRNGK